MANSLEGTRLKILAILQMQGSATVDQLAQSIGLASATIRRHLDILQRDHLVSFQQVRKKLGRPEYVYSLTEAGRESGRRDYGKLLSFFLEEVESLTPDDLDGKDGKNLLPTLFNRISHRWRNSYQAAVPTTNSATSLEQLKRILDDEGFSPNIEIQGGNLQIRLCNCPFRAAALCQESVCCIDHDLISDVLGVEPVRTSSIHHGDTSCTYMIALEGAN